MNGLKPDESYCRKCGAVVRFGNVMRGRGAIGVALDAEKVEHGAYRLKEEIDEEGAYTGRWIATYVRSRDRKKTKGYRPHSCNPERVARLEAIRMGRA